MCVNGILNNYVCFIELSFTDLWHAIPVRGPGSLPLPPLRVKKEKNSEGRKAGRASKTKLPLPLAQGLKLPLNTLTNTIFLWQAIQVQ